MVNQRGMGMPEILMALLLASFIMTILMCQYLTTKRHYHFIQSAVEESIDLQVVIELLRNSSRKAGFTPCGGIDHLMTMDTRHETKPLVAIGVSAEAKSLLQINRMSEHFNTVLRLVGPSDLLTTDREPFIHNESVLIADCYHAEVQKISRVNDTSAGQIITLMKPLTFVYHNPIYVGKWLEETYSIYSHQHSEGSVFYRLGRAEELTTVVHTLSAHLTRLKGRTLVKIILGLDNKRKIELETMVRAS